MQEKLNVGSLNTYKHTHILNLYLHSQEKLNDSDQCGHIHTYIHAYINTYIHLQEKLNDSDQCCHMLRGEVDQLRSELEVRQSEVEELQVLLDHGRSAAEVTAQSEDLFRRLMMVCMCVCLCVRVYMYECVYAFRSWEVSG